MASQSETSAPASGGGGRQPAGPAAPPHPLLQQGRCEAAADAYRALVERGRLTAGEFEAAIRDCAGSETALESLLMARCRVSKRELGDALSARYHCPFLEFNEKLAISRELVKAINPFYLRVHRWVPLWAEGSTLHVLAREPFRPQTLLDVQQIFPGKAVRFYVGLLADIERFIDSIAVSPPAQAPSQDPEPEPAALEPPDDASDLADESDSAVVKLANQIIVEGWKAGASDIHIEPYDTRDTIVRFRINGECQIFQKVPRRYRHALVSRLKIMARLDISERRKPQDGKITVKINDRRVELRMATLPTVGDNEDVVLRILASGEPVPLEKVGMSAANLRDIHYLLQMPHGLFLCVGPTGSGKTTTLHSCLYYLNGPDIKIWTAEDPVEITQFGLRQVQMQPRIGLTFAATLRSFLRADPDVIMVGEMRDRETAEVAIEACLTGHLVLSTLHTNGAIETIVRLLDMGLDPFNYADALLGVLAQRLVRRLCMQCRKPYHPTADQYEELARHFGREAFAGVAPPYDAATTFYASGGCAACEKTGYSGRIAIHELLVATDAIKKLIQSRAPSFEILAAARAAGMLTLLQDGIVKCLKGETDYAQVRSAAMK